MARQLREGSLAGGDELVEGILRQDKEFKQDLQSIRMKKDAARASREEQCERAAKELLTHFSGRARRALEETLEAGPGGDWLSHAPLDFLGLSMDRQTFRDAIALRMGTPFPDDLPDFCPSCGGAFDVSHALKCKKGNWVTRRHNEVAKAWLALFRKASATVTSEPFLAAPVGLKRTSSSTKDGARADIFATGIIRAGQGTFFDVAVLDTGADCHLPKKALRVLTDREGAKTGKYEERALLLGATFVPLVCSVYGTLAPEAAKTLTLAVAKLNEETEEKRSTGKLLRVGVQVAILKATSLCLRARSMDDIPDPHAIAELEDCVMALVDACPLTDEGPTAPRGLQSSSSVF
jgi:hypothetical protein